MTNAPPGPYSVHPYSRHQTRKTITDENGKQWDAATITIGAGRKIIGEVSLRTSQDGYPAIDSEDEMRAVAALWIAAPDLLAASAALVEYAKQGKGVTAKHLNQLQDAIARARDTAAMVGGEVA